LSARDKPATATTSVTTQNVLRDQFGQTVFISCDASYTSDVQLFLELV
jgi:hypothetical protein